MNGGGDDVRTDDDDDNDDDNVDEEDGEKDVSAADADDRMLPLPKRSCSVALCEACHAYS